MADITKLTTPIIQGEGKWFEFTYDQAMPADGPGVYTFIIKESVGAATTLYTAVNIDDTNRATGVILANLPASASVLLAPGTYYGEMSAVMVADTDVDKKIIQFKVEPKL